MLKQEQRNQEKHKLNEEPFDEYLGAIKTSDMALVAVLTIMVVCLIYLWWKGIKEPTVHIAKNEKGSEADLRNFTYTYSDFGFDTHTIGKGGERSLFDTNKCQVGISSFSPAQFLESKWREEIISHVKRQTELFSKEDVFSSIIIRWEQKLVQIFGAELSTQRNKTAFIKEKLARMPSADSGQALEDLIQNYKEDWTKKLEEAVEKFLEKGVLTLSEEEILKLRTDLLTKTKDSIKLIESTFSLSSKAGDHTLIQRVMVGLKGLSKKIQDLSNSEKKQKFILQLLEKSPEQFVRDDILNLKELKEGYSFTGAWLVINWMPYFGGSDKKKIVKNKEDVEKAMLLLFGAASSESGKHLAEISLELRKIVSEIEDAIRKRIGADGLSYLFSATKDLKEILSAEGYLVLLDLLSSALGSLQR